MQEQKLTDVIQLSKEQSDEVDYEARSFVLFLKGAYSQLKYKILVFRITCLAL